MPCRSSPEGPPSRCLDTPPFLFLHRRPVVAVKTLRDPYGINLRPPRAPPLRIQWLFSGAAVHRKRHCGVCRLLLSQGAQDLTTLPPQRAPALRLVVMGWGADEPQAHTELEQHTTQSKPNKSRVCQSKSKFRNNSHVWGTRRAIRVLSHDFGGRGGEGAR